jgi:endonuclease YncB( thermonuclease family)
MAIAGARGQNQTTISSPVPCPARGLTVDAEVIKIVDGDTIDVRVEFKFRVRLLDCWAPESRTRDTAEKILGLASKGYLLDLADGQRVRVHVPGSDNLAEVLTLDRVLGRAYILKDGDPELSDLSWQMVQAGHATPIKIKEPPNE